MKERLVLVVALVWCAVSGAGEQPGFKRPYFGGTKPGTFAHQRATDEKGAVTEYTYSRLTDVAGERVIELNYEIVSGQFKGTKSVTGCLVPASFPLESDAIDFQAHARRCVAAAGGARATEYPAATMKAIASGMTDYAAIATFKGAETVNGKPADRYGYEYKASYMNIPATTTGDLWLSDAVPFGLVKDVMTMRDGSGKTLTRIETVLVESGEGTRTALPGWSWTGPTKRRAGSAHKPH